MNWKIEWSESDQAPRYYLGNATYVSYENRNLSTISSSIIEEGEKLYNSKMAEPF